MWSSLTGGQLRPIVTGNVAGAERSAGGLVAKTVSCNLEEEEMIE